VKAGPQASGLFRSNLSSISSASFSRSPSIREASIIFFGTLLLLSAGLIIYSQTRAFSLDEGFHLLAAQLINAGKKPYLDFCFPQPPLSTYWNAAWMRAFGDSWRLPHFLAALMTSGSLILTAEFVFSRFPVSEWRFPAAIASAFMLACSVPVVQFGTVQAYGICLFLITASFRVALLMLDRKSLSWPLAAGVLAGAAAASSLLSCPVILVLLLWLLRYNRTGNRWIKSAVLILGAVAPFLPVLWLYCKAPGPVFFNLVQYQLFYRRYNWGEASAHDFDVLTAWVDSSPAMMTGLLAIVGVLFLRIKCNCGDRLRAEFYLAAWLAAAITAFLSLAHPTFERYFLLAVPFYAILASLGMYTLAFRLGRRERSFWPATLVILLLCLGLAKRLFDDRDSYTWNDYQKIADKVDQVTSRGAPLWADEVVYFLTRRPPPPGMEFSYSHKLEMPPKLAASLHIVSQSELDRRVKAGAFQTVATCADEDEIDRLGLRRIYSQHAEVSDCEVFWDKR